MRRKALGLISLALLALGIITAVSGPGGSSAIGFAGSAIKAGLVLGALWLALPQIEGAFKRAPRWLLSWFTGKPKPPTAPSSQSPPTARPLRPRRRSNSTFNDQCNDQ